ncbi:hypothetical protein RND71_012589 [Anisodus tanguticus]|uniref:Uncharacterized protein n=1 Tax=Anisodus tanguticus TaxID=243964 RepID=A0AAE1VH38_9SOLA|nr:hypothetical protein RND71_012589 [Anisodus tanguticus]
MNIPLQDINNLGRSSLEKRMMRNSEECIRKKRRKEEENGRIAFLNLKISIQVDQMSKEYMKAIKMI